MHKKLLVFCFMVGLLSFQSCYDLAVEGIDPAGLGIALPLIDSQFRLLEVADKTNNESFFKVDSQGNITLVYEGQLVKNTAISLFPPIPGIFDFEIKSKNDEVPLPLPEKYRVDKGIFAKSKISFLFQTDFIGPYTLNISMPSIKKDGQVWTSKFEHDSDGLVPFVTEGIEMEGWEASLTDGNIKVEYEALDANGDAIKIDYASFRFDIIHFLQIEGFFGSENFDIKGDVIKVGLFSKWVKGGIDFANPELTINVENSFGFPVRSEVKTLFFKLIDGSTFPLESSFIDDGIDFNYPSFEEFGEVKLTEFSFNQNNSNINDLFKQKITEVSYDIDAIANPDDRANVPNFVRDNSYFSVDINLELPLHLTIDAFTIQDTFELPIELKDDVKSASILVNYSNAYPLNFSLQTYTILNGQIVDSLFEEPIFLKENEGLDEVQKDEVYINPAALIENATYVNQMVIDQISTGSPKQNVFITDDHFLDLKMGIKLTY